MDSLINIEVLKQNHNAAIAYLQSLIDSGQEILTKENEDHIYNLISKD